MCTITIYYETDHTVVLKFIINTFTIKLLCWVPKTATFRTWTIVVLFHDPILFIS